MFNAAVELGHLPETFANPTQKVPAFHENDRDRWVQPHELPALWNAIQADSNPYVRAFFVLALLLGTRRSELLNAKWENVDLTRAVIRLPDTKAGNDHDLPLQPEAVSILRNLPRLLGNPYVFPSPVEPGQPMRVVVRGNHGAGKDAVLAPIMLYACYVLKMLVLAISATEKQLLGQLWRELTNRFSERLPGQLFTADLRLAGEKRIIAMTSGNVSNLTGWHDPNGVFIAISEAQGEQVEAAAFDAAIANAVDAASRIIVVGNPVKSAGRFYEVSRKETWHAIQISAFDHPNIPEGRVVIPGGPSPEWPAEMAREFGVDSPWYVSRVLGEFPPQGSVDGLVKLEWLEASYERHEAGPGLVNYPLPVVALDVARSLDRDESVAAVVQGPRVHALATWRVRDLVETTTRFLTVVDRARMEWYATTKRKTVDTTGKTYRDPDALAAWLTASGVPAFQLIVDAPGIGSGVVDDLKRRGRSVTEYWGWNPSTDPQKWLNRRAEIYWHLRTLLENGTVELPRDQLLHEELLACEWSQDAKGRIMLGPKEMLRAMLGRSPDRLDSVTIGLAHATGAIRQPGVVFEHYNPY